MLHPKEGNSSRCQAVGKLTCELNRTRAESCASYRDWSLTAGRRTFRAASRWASMSAALCSGVRFCEVATPGCVRGGTGGGRRSVLVGILGVFGLAVTTPGRGIPPPGELAIKPGRVKTGREIDMRDCREIGPVGIFAPLFSKSSTWTVPWLFTLTVPAVSSMASTSTPPSR